MITVCYILRDAKKHIKKSLESVKDFDEIICVIDTRTTDDTATICEQYAKVYKHDFKGFASQRNFGLSKCSGDWVIVLDADESLTEKACKQIKELTKLDIDIWSVIQLDKSGQMCRTFRVFKKDVRYSEGKENEIHETINIEGHTTGHSDIVFNHNKDLTKEEHENKMDWILGNIEGISDGIKKDYYQGIYYVHTGEHTKGMECLNRVINQVPPSLKGFIKLAVAKIYSALSQVYEIESLHLIHESLKDVPIQNEGYYMLSNYYKKIKEPEKANEYLKQMAGITTNLQNDILRT